MKKLNPNELVEGEIVRYKRREVVFINFSAASQEVTLDEMTIDGYSAGKEFTAPVSAISSANTKRKK